MAEESLRAVTRLQVGTGALSEDSARQIVDEWEDAQYGEEGRPPVTATAADLQKLGIDVELVPPRKG